MRLLLEKQRCSQTGYFFCVDQVTFNKLMAVKRRSESFSDVTIRMAKADTMVSTRSSSADTELQDQ
jgi:predicted CopG family antitoxin